MQMLFIDESGTPPPKPGKQKYFVLGGLVLPEGVWHDIEKELNHIKKRHNVVGEIKWRFFSPHNRDKDNSLAHLTPDAKNQFRDELFSLITARRAVKVISVIASVEACYERESINTSDELYQFAYKPLTERFQYYLQDLEKESGTKTNGIIVCDHRGPRDDKRLQELHQKLVNQEGIHSTQYKNLIEGLFIAPSHWSIGIQLADLVAGAIYRKYENGDERFFEKIRGSIRSVNGAIEGYGLVKQPKHRWR